MAVDATLEDIKPKAQLTGESDEDYINRQYQMYLDANVELEEVDISTPVDEFPSFCGSSEAFDQLNGLIADIADGLTYGKWLSEQDWVDVCAIEVSDYQTILDSVSAQNDQAQLVKEAAVAELFSSFGAAGETIDDYINNGQSLYEDAKEADDLPVVSDIASDVGFVEPTDTCIADTAPIVAQISI